MQYLKPEIKDLIGKRKLWIWGAKVRGIAISGILERNGLATVEGYIDSSQLAQKRTVRGKKVISFEEFLATHTLKDTYIIIASRQFFDVISKNLMEKGLKANSDFYNGSQMLGPIYEIDLSSACNLRCPSCPQANFPLALPSSKMSEEMFDKILNKILADTPHLAYINLFCWSEPFLHPGLATFIRKVKARNVPCFVSSNMNFDKTFKDVMQANPDFFRVSTSGYTQKIYEIDHAKGDINLVKSNMYKLRYYIDKYKTDTLAEVAYHRYDYNLGEELESMKRLCAELDFAMPPFDVFLQPIEYLIDYFEGKELSTELLETLYRTRFDYKNYVPKDLTNTPEACFSFHNIIPVLPDGMSVLCDFAFDPKRSVSTYDFLNTSYEEILQAKRNNVICQKCLKWGIPNILLGTSDDLGTYDYLFKDKVTQA